MNLKEQIPMTAQMSDDAAKVDRGNFRQLRRHKKKSASPSGAAYEIDEHRARDAAKVDRGNFRQTFARRPIWQLRRHKKKYAAPEGLAVADNWSKFSMNRQRSVEGEHADHERKVRRRRA